MSALHLGYMNPAESVVSSTEEEEWLALEPFWAFWRRENFLPSVENETMINFQSLLLSLMLSQQLLTSSSSSLLLFVTSFLH